MLTEKVLFDTDIGSDIDDAVALAYLLAQPRCELLGITTVSGATEQRAALADALLRRAGKRVPIVAGAPKPILGPSKQPNVDQAEALARWEHGPYEIDTFAALDFMRRTIRENPGEVTLLAVGPMTNVGLLFAMEPELAGLLKRLVLMCGDFDRISGQGRGEWNAINDPEATARVYEARAKTHRSVGLNVTNQVRLPASEVRERFAKHELLHPVLDFAEVWFRERPQITFHDPLAAVTIFDEGVCGYQNMLVEPETRPGRGNAVTWAAPKEDGPHQVAVTVDAERFFGEYFSVFR